MNKKCTLVKVLDGGFSTQLSKYDAGFQDHPLWCSLMLYKNPRIVYQTHLDFLKGKYFVFAVIEKIIYNINKK